MGNLFNKILNELSSKEWIIAFSSIAILIIFIKILPRIIVAMIKRRNDMKRMGLVLLVVPVFLFSCTMWIKSHTELTKNEKGEVITKYVRDTQGLSWNDPETANTLARADSIARANQNNNRRTNRGEVEVDIKNHSSFGFEVEDGEFRGLVLGIGEESNYAKQIHTGLYTLKIKYVDKTGTERRRKVSRVITPETQSIILTDVRR